MSISRHFSKVWKGPVDWSQSAVTNVMQPIHCLQIVLCSGKSAKNAEQRWTPKGGFSDDRLTGLFSKIPMHSRYTRCQYNWLEVIWGSFCSMRWSCAFIYTLSWVSCESHQLKTKTKSKINVFFSAKTHAAMHGLLVYCKFIVLAGRYGIVVAMMPNFQIHQYIMKVWRYHWILIIELANKDYSIEIFVMIDWFWVYRYVNASPQFLKWVEEGLPSCNVWVLRYFNPVT